MCCWSFGHRRNKLNTAMVPSNKQDFDEEQRDVEALRVLKMTADAPTIASLACSLVMIDPPGWRPRSEIVLWNFG